MRKTYRIVLIIKKCYKEKQFLQIRDIKKNLRRKNELTQNQLKGPVMSVKGIMTGSPYHVGRLTRPEDDPRRHRSRCIYFNRENKICANTIMKCTGSAHCEHYSEDTSDKKIPRKSRVQANKAPFKAKKPESKKVSAKNHTEKQNKFEDKLRVKGTKVCHNKYGNGVIKKVTCKDVTIQFESGKESRFDIETCVNNQYFTVINGK